MIISLLLGRCYFWGGGGGRSAFRPSRDRDLRAVGINIRFAFLSCSACYLLMVIGNVDDSQDDVICHLLFFQEELYSYCYRQKRTTLEVSLYFDEGFT